MPPTKEVEQLQEWIAVGQNVVGESGILNCADHYATELYIQAFLDTEDPHLGTEFIIQVSSKPAGDEDWHDYTRFLALVGTANEEPITDDPLNSASVTINVADTGGKYEDGPFGSTWIGIKDGTIANSELVLLIAFSANSDITIKDGTTHGHLQNVNMYDVAISESRVLDPTVKRVRVLVNNTVDAGGSTLVYKVRAAKVTAI